MAVTNHPKISRPKKLIILLIVFVLVASSLMTISSRQAKAGDWWYVLKEFIIKPLVKKIANSLANRLANFVYDKVSGKTDKHEPFFVLSWRNLILESQARGNDVFRSMLQGTDFCGQFKDSLIKSFGADFAPSISGNSIADENDNGFRTFLGTPGDTPFDFMNKCSLTINVDDFTKDFRNGGWDAWGQILETQNNYFGAFAAATGEKDHQEAIDQQAALNQAIAGQGFLPNRLDKTKGRGGGPRGCSITGQNRCSILGRIIAPEKLFGDSVTQTINTKIGSYYNAQELTDVVIALFDAITSGLLGRLTDISGFDVAKFAEQQFESDYGSVDKEAQGHLNALQICLNSCPTKAANACTSGTPEEEATCRANALAACQTQCHLDN